MQTGHVEQVDGAGKLIKRVIDESVVDGYRRQCIKEGIVRLGACRSYCRPGRRLRKGIRLATRVRGSERAHLVT